MDRQEEVRRKELRRQEALKKIYKDLDTYATKNEKDREEGKDSLFFDKVERIVKSFNKEFEGSGINLANVGEEGTDNDRDYIVDEANLLAHDLYDEEIDSGVLGETAIKYEDEYREELLYKIVEYVYMEGQSNQ